ncbi:MAG TPA: TolC family protein [Acidobacteriaceae bacterium]|jgi:outer membrane protein|nr:TolC family protein [Acidobacteriaceae bacterium]
MKSLQVLSWVALVAVPSLAAAQSALPAAPGPQVVNARSSAHRLGSLALLQSPAAPTQSAPAAPASAPAAQPPDLTLAQAEQLAIRNNPHVTVGRLLALAQHQVYREARAAELPDATFDATAVNSVEASRIGAVGPGLLTSSRLLEHAGAGINVNQLIYDFGHTHNLVLSQKLSEKASDANALATTEEIVLATDQAFYDALMAQAELDVARQTVATRQTTDTQVGEMTRNKLKSTLDLSFADVDLSQAQLLQLDAQSNTDASMAALDAVLGLDRSVTYHLIEDTAAPPPPPADVAPLIQTALQQRPDLQALTLDTQSAQKFARAQWDQMLPSITAAGTVGVLPVDPGSYYIDNWWGAFGGNLNVPVFNGFLYISQAREAKYRAQAAAENSRDLRDRIVRDVRTSWLQAGNNWQRMTVTAQLVKEANLAMALAQTRYKLGLSSIVELSQAQLQQTSAQIQNTSARYQYRLSLSTLNYEMGVAP